MDTTVLQFLAAPFAASLILTGIHAYLGVHVVERGVIFVDLSLAQIAALGATIAVLMPFTAAIRITLACTGSAWVSRSSGRRSSRCFTARRRGFPRRRSSASAMPWPRRPSIVAMSSSTSQAEHLQHMLVGNILAVSWPEVLKTAALYGVVGTFHYVFRRRFLLISMDRARAAAQGVSVRFWDFLFYASFGFVVTSSVSIAGVLLVFCYLIVPSVAAMLYADRVGPRLAIGWTMGTIVSALGVYLSLQLDLPTGATIVCTFGVVLAVMAALKPLIR